MGTMAATMELTRITRKQTLISESWAYASFGAAHVLPFGATEDYTGGAPVIPSERASVEEAQLD
jgi:hypothetical protein